MVSAPISTDIPFNRPIPANALTPAFSAQYPDTRNSSNSIWHNRSRSRREHKIGSTTNTFLLCVWSSSSFIHPKWSKKRSSSTHFVASNDSTRRPEMAFISSPTPNVFFVSFLFTADDTTAVGLICRSTFTMVCVVVAEPPAAATRPANTWSRFP